MYRMRVPYYKYMYIASRKNQNASIIASYTIIIITTDPPPCAGTVLPRCTDYGFCRMTAHVFASRC